MNEPLTFETAPDVLTVRDAAALLRVSVDTIYDAVRTGQLAGVKLRGRVLISKEVLRAFVSGGQPLDRRL